MSYQEVYKQKLTTADEAVKAVKSGDWVDYGWCTNHPVALDKALAARKDGLLCRAGESFPAHEFHYWDSTTPGADFHAQKPLSDRGWDCAFHTPTLYAGFPHFHFWARPELARHFVAAARRYHQQEALL